MALATGARVSEIHALSRNPERFKRVIDGHSGKRTLIVHTKVGFVPKNSKPSVRPEPLHIVSMKHLVGRHEPERFICPVRAVEVYMHRTPDGTYPVSDETLLRHPKPTIRTTKGHIALWIKKCVELAYQTAGNTASSTKITNAHEVRAIAHSMVAFSGASLEEIMEAGRWASSNSFLEHYYRDLRGYSTGRSTP